MDGGRLNEDKHGAEGEREMERDHSSEEKREREHKDYSSEREGEKETERDREREMGGSLEKNTAKGEREGEGESSEEKQSAEGEREMHEEKIYELIAVEENTPYNLRLSVTVKGESLEFRGDASAMFREGGANPLQNAKLRTPDLQALASHASLFVFHFRPSHVEVRFFDPLAMTASPSPSPSPLGVLYADPLPLHQSQRCPRTGTGTWSTIF